MFQTLSKKLKNRKGFTLIELIVVLAILGIILAIAVPNYLGVQATSALNADTSSSELVEKAVKLWYAAENITEEGFTITAIGTMADGTGTAPTGDDVTAFADYLEAWPTPSSSTNDALTVTVTSIQNIQATWSTK